MTTHAELTTWLERTRQHAASTEDAVESAIAIYQAAAANIDAMRAVQAEAKAIIGEIMAETGRCRYATLAGTCYVSAASYATSYDAKALDALAATDERIAALLAPARRITERAGTLTVRAPGGTHRVSSVQDES